MNFFVRTISRTVSKEQCETVPKEVCTSVKVPSCTTRIDTITKQVRGARAQIKSILYVPVRSCMRRCPRRWA
jgi:hypothetical protein